MAVATMSISAVANATARALSTRAAPLKSLAPRPAFFGSGSQGLRALSSSRPASLLATGRRAFSARAAAVGEKLPAGEFAFFDKDGNMQTISVDALTKGKKVVLFAVPGAFTPTCSMKHLPGFISKADDLKAKGIDTIACVSVNDAFVMKAWGESVGAGDKVLLLADGSGKFTEDLGVTLDLSDKGLGKRSRRYALLADDGVIKMLNLEEGGAFTFSGAEDVLKAL